MMHSENMRNVKNDNKILVMPKLEDYPPKFVATKQRYTCGANNCNYLCLSESMLRSHLQVLHINETKYKCTHCHQDFSNKEDAIDIKQILEHLRMHDLNLYKCYCCKFIHYLKDVVDTHVINNYKTPLTIIVREMCQEPIEIPIVRKQVDLTKPWCCGICDYRCRTKDYIIAHVLDRHDLDFQFKCSLCQYASDSKQLVSSHFKKEHSKRADIFVEVQYTYYQNVNSVNLDRTPICEREKSNGKQTREALTDKSNKENQLVKTAVSGRSKSDNTTKITNVPKKAKRIKNTNLQLITKKKNIRINNKSILKKNKYVCPICITFRTHTKKKMAHHLYKELNYSRYVCKVCKLKCTTYNCLKKHYKKEHLKLPETIHMLDLDLQIEESVEYALSVQDRLITNKEFDAGSKTTLQPYKKMKSRGIDESSSTKALQVHIKVPNTHQCRYCIYICKTAVDLKKHEQMHLLSKFFQRLNSDIKDVTNHQILQHSKDVHQNIVPIGLQVPEPSTSTNKSTTQKQKNKKTDFINIRNSYKI